MGRGLFWRFLVDRGLLAEIEPRDVAGTATTFSECMDTKARALRTFQWLDDTFNGGLLTFDESPHRFPAEVFSAVLGHIAHGATASGQLRLPTDWDEVNFAYVPVGLLSEVYEAFAHRIDASEAAAKSIHYTPSHLVDFVVSQALAELPAGGRPRVLDPATGAGVFLVTALRQLVEREWRERGQRPPRRRIREILNQQLTGFDVDPRALRLAELALYLTALELDPAPRPVDRLRFAALRGTVLIEVSGDEGDGSLGPVPSHFRNHFDVVVGNPPWTAKVGGLVDKERWVENTRAIVRERLSPQDQASFDFPDTNMDLPFVWRAMEWARPGGRIALITHARWLFGFADRAAEARSALLRATRVTGILNGSALRFTKVWPSVNVEWCILFAKNERPDPLERAAIQFVSPTLDVGNDSKQSRLRVDWLDGSIVPVADVIRRPWLLKMRFRGNRLAEGALATMRRSGRPLSESLPGVQFRNGYQVGGKARQEKQVNAEHMAGLPDTKGSRTLPLVIDTTRLRPFTRPKLLSPRDPAIYTAPLLLVRESIPSDRLEVRASRSETESLVYHASFHGLSLAGVPDGVALIRYLQLWFQSTAMVFTELMTDARFGVGRDTIYQESLRHLPIVPWDALDTPLRRRARKLSERLVDRMTERLARDVDDFVFDTYELSDVERTAIQDTVETASPATRAKKRAATPPTEQEQDAYATTLRTSLNAVLGSSGDHARVTRRGDLQWEPWEVLEVDWTKKHAHPIVQEEPIVEFLEEANAQGASIVKAWMSDTRLYIGLLRRYSLWTATRARLLAVDILAEEGHS